MKTLQAIYLALILLLNANFTLADGTWETVDVPGAGGTSICGMYGETIVGYYNVGANKGFIYTGRTNWITIYYPVDAYVNGIYGSNVVWDNSGMDSEDGTVYNYLNKTAISVNPPGSQQARAAGIWGDNVVGDCAGGPYAGGYIYNIPTKTWTSLNMPGAAGTSPEGICENKIVGMCADAVRWHGFLYDGATWAIFDVPGSIHTWAEGVYGDKIVGSYYDTNWNAHAFLYNGTSFTTIDMPGAQGTMAYGIYGNKVVGGYKDKYGYAHGFIYTILGPALNLSTQSTNTTVAFSAMPGDVYNIETSTDLVHWVTATTVVVNASSNVLYTQNTSAPKMFYRASQ